MAARHFLRSGGGWPCFGQRGPAAAGVGDPIGTLGCWQRSIFQFSVYRFIGLSLYWFIGLSVYRFIDLSMALMMRIFAYFAGTLFRLDDRHGNGLVPTSKFRVAQVSARDAPSVMHLPL